MLANDSAKFTLPSALCQIYSAKSTLPNSLCQITVPSYSHRLARNLSLEEYLEAFLRQRLGFHLERTPLRVCLFGLVLVKRVSNGQLAGHALCDQALRSLEFIKHKSLSSLPPTLRAHQPGNTPFHRGLLSGYSSGRTDPMCVQPEILDPKTFRPCALEFCARLCEGGLIKLPS